MKNVTTERERWAYNKKTKLTLDSMEGKKSSSMFKPNMKTIKKGS